MIERFYYTLYLLFTNFLVILCGFTILKTQPKVEYVWYKFGVSGRDTILAEKQCIYEVNQIVF